MFKKLLLIFIFIFSFGSVCSANNDLAWLLNKVERRKGAVNLNELKSYQVIEYIKLDIFEYCEREANAKFIDNVRGIPEIYEFRFTGVHRFWTRRLNRYYDSNINSDRDQYIDNSLKPALAMRTYDDSLLKINNNPQHLIDRLPWNSIKERRTCVFGNKREMCSIGPLVVTNDFRIRVDLDEVPVVKEYLALDFSNDEDDPSEQINFINYQPLNPIQAFQVFQKVNSFKIRARINAKLDQSEIGLRSIGFKVDGVFQLKHFALPISTSVSVKHDVEDNNSLLAFNFVI